MTDSVIDVDCTRPLGRLRNRDIDRVVTFDAKVTLEDPNVEWTEDERERHRWLSQPENLREWSLSLTRLSRDLDRQIAEIRATSHRKKRPLTVSQQAHLDHMVDLQDTIKERREEVGVLLAEAQEDRAVGKTPRGRALEALAVEFPERFAQLLREQEKPR